MKILMMGLGSIGQRHVRNIKEIFGDEAELIAYRSVGNKRLITEKLGVLEDKNVEDEYKIVSYTDMDEALAQKPEVAFITNVTAKHMECAIKAAKAGCNLMIEKPLSVDLSGVNELREIIKDKDLTVSVGFQNRYHPCIKVLKETVESGILGRIRYVSNEFSERLTTIHRYEDYRHTYMARRDLGGGPVLNLLIHDFDILQWIFGLPQSVSGKMMYGGDLEIDVEEGASAVFTFGEGKESFPVYTHTDFMQYPPVHTFKVVGEKGRIELDMNTSEYVIYCGDEIYKTEMFSDFRRNDMFLQEIKDYFESLKNQTEPKLDLESGINTLKMVEMLRKSDSEKREIKLSEIS